MSHTADYDAVLADALSVSCPVCETPPDLWCFPDGPRPTIHGRRITERPGRPTEGSGT